MGVLSRQEQLLKEVKILLVEQNKKIDTLNSALSDLGGVGGSESASDLELLLLKKIVLALSPFENDPLVLGIGVTNE